MSSYKDTIDILKQENNNLKQHISSLQELLGSDICKFFERCQSIRKTRKRFCYETISECYKDLVYFYGCSDPLEDAEDYKECFKEIFEKEHSDNDTDKDGDCDDEDKHNYDIVQE